MGTKGLYRIERGGSIPQPLTQGRLPDIMSNIDRDSNRVVMAYDRKRHGILITITDLQAGTGTSWWYDLRTDGFFPEAYLTGMGPFSSYFYDADGDTYQHLLLGCDDGYIRFFDDTEQDDEDTDGTEVAVTSYVLLGPMDITTDDREGKLVNSNFTLGSSTTNVNYNIYVNNSAEELLDDVANAGLQSGSFTSGGRQYDVRTKAKGVALGIKLGNSTSSKTFAVEKVNVKIVPAGRLKKS